MKDYWKHFANDYWTNKLCWKVFIKTMVSFVKDYKNFLSNNAPEDREKFEIL